MKEGDKVITYLYEEDGGRIFYIYTATVLRVGDPDTEVEILNSIMGIKKAGDRRQVRRRSCVPYNEDGMKRVLTDLFMMGIAK